jgi:DNA polymerase III subunit chi
MSFNPQVDFYILQQQNTEQFICQLVSKIWQQSYKIYVHSSGLNQAKKLDDLLWIFQQDSFIPHDLYPDVTSIAPIRIGYKMTEYWPGEVLVNLLVTDKVVDFYNQFQRVAEVISADEQAKQYGRMRYKFYQAQNLNIKVHQLR